MTVFLQLLLDSSLRIGIAGLFAGAALLAAQVRSSALRHKVWLAVLCGMLLMPILPRLAPRLELPIPGTAPAEPLHALIPVAVAAETPPLAAHVPTDHAPSVPAPLPATRPLSPVASGFSRKMLAPILLAVYIAGVLLFLARIFLGWIFARRLVRSCRATSIHGVIVYACAGVCSPLTVGVFRQRILFPENFAAWSEEKLRAVLAHELAHVRRRDTATNFLAHLNRCFFWFHPLAWWIERQLAATAEEICDDAGVLALGASRRYAEVLMDVAQTARRRNQRLALQGVGVDGSGLLTQRVGRLLRGAPSLPASTLQQVFVAAVCAAAICAAAACQQKSVAALKADPQYAQQIAQSVASNQLWQEIGHMTAADAETLEASVRQNPEDAPARKKLMTFYQSKSRAILGDEKTAKGFWSIRLWCIEHHPEDPCAWVAEPLFDPASYKESVKLWDAILKRPGVTAEVQLSAVRYFQRTDPQRAEQIVRSGSIDTKSRTQLLSNIYVSALRGAETPYARDLRKRLDTSSDAALLSATGIGLARGGPPESASAALGRKYIGRAHALDPNLSIGRKLAQIDQINSVRQSYLELVQAVGGEVSEAQYQKAAALPADRRARSLPDLAERAYWAGASATDSNHNTAAAHQDWILAQKYAKDALAVEEDFRNDPDYPNRVYKTDVVLAMLAVRADGNDKEARRYLLSAAPLKTSDDTWFPATLKALVLLIRYGNADDRAAVIDFCETHGKLVHYPGVDLLQSAQKLRAGLMPTWYQFEVTQFPEKPAL